MQNYLTINPEVQDALARGKAIVALESTVISHGLPYPHNIELARKLEQHVRDGGATPATIALAQGRVHIGLDVDLLEQLATGKSVSKVSLRDMGLVLAEGGMGATTVATTMWAAHAAGIQVFATGGIGGVHPGNGSDISADLPALATIPVCVVSSGAKAILDLPRTREWLETWGVPILGWHTHDFPAFYSRNSGLPVDRRVDSAAQAARLIRAHLQLGRSGILLGSPVPFDAEIDTETVQQWIDMALAEAGERGVKGYALTPFLLSTLGERSGGQTLRANLALLENNAKVAAEIATTLSP